jgi:uncharacterized membrane protein
MAALTAAAGLTLVAGWSPGLFLVTVEAAMLGLLVRRGAPPSLEDVAHLLAFGVCLAFLPIAAASDPDGVILTEGAWARLGVLAMLLATSLLVRADMAGLYRLAAHVGLLVWFLLELDGLPNGVALVSVAWALQGALVLVGSIRRESPSLKVLGLATLGLVAAKLLLVDLSTVDAVWRIFLFLGFGTALLGLSWLIDRPRGRAPGGGTIPT